MIVLFEVLLCIMTFLVCRKAVCAIDSPSFSFSVVVSIVSENPTTTPGNKKDRASNGSNTGLEVSTTRFTVKKIVRGTHCLSVCLSVCWLRSQTPRMAIVKMVVSGPLDYLAEVTSKARAKYHKRFIPIRLSKLKSND